MIRSKVRGLGYLFSIASKENCTEFLGKPIYCTRYFSGKKMVAVKNPWTEVPDPKGSNLTYWWNKETNETTSVGEPRPHYWIEQKDPSGSNLTYWWNPETNETTALGASRPSHSHIQPLHEPSSSSYSFGGMMLQGLTMGAGVSLAFVFVRFLFG